MIQLPANIRRITRFICMALAMTLLSTCTQPESQTPSDPVPQILPQPDHTGYQFPETTLPTGWDWEEITLEDSLERSIYHAQFPLAPDALEFLNPLISKAVQSRIDDEAAYVDPYQGESPSSPIFSFEMGLTAFYMDASHLSLRFVIDCYTEGGNHHNYSWFAVNIGLLQRSLLGFQDVFRLRGRNDSLAFVEVVRRHAADQDCMDWGLPLENVEFAFKQDSIQILPELSWACTMNTSTIPRDSLKRFLR